MLRETGLEVDGLRRSVLKALCGAGVSLAAFGATGCGYFLATRGVPLEASSVAPDFQLPSEVGAAVSLEQLVARGPAVLVFYRGFW